MIFKTGAQYFVVKAKIMMEILVPREQRKNNFFIKHRVHGSNTVYFVSNHRELITVPTEN